VVAESGKKRLAINLVANVVSLFVNLAVSFFIAPYIINSVGKEAYGFVGLALNFTTYAALATISINSMAGRFIAIQYHQRNFEKANTYFNSTLIANIAIAGVLSIPAVLCIVFIEHIVQIPTNLIADVKWLFALVFLSFLVTTALTVYSVATFIRNRLDIASIKGIIGSLLRVSLLVGLYTVYRPQIAYMGIAFFIATVYDGLASVWITNRLVPNLELSAKRFSLTATKELISSGSWNALNSVGNIAANGLDLLIANLFLGASAMGVLAVAKTIPIVLWSLVGTISRVFAPQMTALYAKGDNKGLKLEIDFSLKVMGFVTSIPIALIVGFGYVFFSLWVPKENARILHIISIICVSDYVVAGSLQSLYNVFTITNKVRISSIFYLCTGILNAILVITLLWLIPDKSLGIYTVAGVSSIIGIFSASTFLPIYSARCLGYKSTTFYNAIIRTVLACLVLSSIAMLLASIIRPHNWLMLLANMIGLVAIGFLTNGVLIFDAHDRNIACKLLTKLISRGSNR
jgi:O-antigen/teichoic acid export membrane protein